MKKPSKSKYSKAVALQYSESDDEAPVVSLKGQSIVADDLVKLAKRYGVPIVEKPELATALNQVEIDEEIPEGLFEAVAIVLREIEKKN